MTIQIAVRLPDDIVSHVDQLVREGAPSRASVVGEALKVYFLRLDAERDARILEETGDYDDLRGLTTFNSLAD